MKRLSLLIAALVATPFLVIGVEIALAMRREYLPTEPAFEIGGVHGAPNGKRLRFVVLGDSTAAGLGASSPDRAYASLLAERIADLGYLVEMTGVGVSGARVRDVLDEQVEAALALEPDLVFICIGANDVTHMTSLHSIERDMGEVYDRLLSSGAIVVGSGIPDMRADAWLEPLRSIAGWRGREVTGAVRAAAEARDIPFVPLADKTAPFFAENPEAAYSDDAFHPGDGGYSAWADAIFPVIEGALATRNG